MLITTFLMTNSFPTLSYSKTDNFLIFIIDIGDERSTRGLSFSYLFHPSKKYSIQKLCFCALESKSTASKESKH